MLHASSEEPFLTRACESIANITVSRVNREVGDFMISLIQAAALNGNLQSFLDVTDSCCLILYKCAEIVPEIRQEAVKTLKSLLVNFCQYGSTNKAVGDVGKYMGMILKLIIDEGNDVFCESYVTNLAIEIPVDAEIDGAMNVIIGALGSIAVGVQNDKIVKICLSTLTAQFKKSGNSRPLDAFYEQFNIIASCSSVANMSTVIDMYVGKYMEFDPSTQKSSSSIGSTSNQLFSVASAFRSLTLLISKDPIKSEIMLQSILRMFVEKGLAIIKTYHGKHTRSSDPAFSPPIELELLLPLLEPLFAGCGSDDCMNKAAKLEAFQEFWFILIYCGYQQNLNWSESWAPYIPGIALATPVLIKEKDRLKAVTAPLSQVLLSQNTSAQMKAHLTTLMPNCSYLTKGLTLPRCLWLLSIFHSETHKIKHGIITDMMTYMTSEIVKQFELEPFIEDLFGTIFKRWLPNASSGNQAIIDDYACSLLEYCCHSQERVHVFAMRFLKMILDNHKQTYSCHKLWEAFLEKIMKQYEICRRVLGEENISESSMALSSDYGRKSFESLVTMARTIFAAASAEYPHDFYAFIQKSLHRQKVFFEGRPGDRDIRMLELLRICMPQTSEASTNYLGLALEFQSKPEDYIKWLLCRGKTDFNCPSELVAKFTGSFKASPGCVTLSTRNALENFDLEKLESIVAYPFIFGTAEAFKEAVYCWAWLLDQKPEFTTSFLSLISLAWVSHVKQTDCPFNSAPPPHIFSGKMDTSETKITSIVPQSSPSIPYIILIDYLHERLLLCAREGQAGMKSLNTILIRMLSDYLRVLGQPRMRAALLKTCVLAMEFLRQYEQFLSAFESGFLRSHLYKLLISWFEQPYIFYSEDRDFMKYEEGLLLKLRNYFSDEGQIVGRLHLRADSAELPSMDSVTEIAGLLRMLLTDDLEKMLIWNNRLSSRQVYLDASTVQQYVSVACKYSVSLAVQIAKRFPYIPKDQALLSIFERHRENVKFNNSQAIEFWLSNGLTIETMSDLMSAPPLPVTAAIDIFRSSKLSANPAIVNYAMRSMESMRPESLYFYIPHIVQALRHDQLGYIERTIMHVARSSSLFAHQIIWNMKANTHQDDLGTIPDPCKEMFEDMITKVSRLMAGIDREFFEREFAFFDKVTAISGALKPFVKKEKWEKKAKIDEELKKIAVDPGVYLPSNPESIVLDIDYDSGRPLQSHAKAPFMATFRVKGAEPDSVPMWQSVIFKVGDDCRQDVLALQFLTAMKNIFSSVGLNLYIFPYRVVATGPGCGVIEVIPNSISRDQLGREKINSLYDYFIFRFGSERTPKFAKARENFVKSMAAYSVACYLLAIKDRHNGNIMVSDSGHIIHIDFGFILDLAPGGISVESPFKLTTEMLAVMGGRDDSSPYFSWYRELCCQGFLALRSHADHLISLVEAMSESGLPCFAKGEAAIRKLRARFRLDLCESDARQFFYDLVYKSCETIRTALYDKYQEKTNGIPY